MDDVGLYASSKASILEETTEVHLNGDNHVQNFHLGRYIVGYTVGKFVSLKLNF